MALGEKKEFTHTVKARRLGALRTTTFHPHYSTTFTICQVPVEDSLPTQELDP